MKMRGGRTTYGEEIGILMLETRFPRLPGDIGNAGSFSFPVRYKTVRGAKPERIMGDRPDPSLLKPFASAARELEAEGVRAITTSCGFLAPFQAKLAESVSVPVFTSSLLLVPLINSLLGGRRTIGIFTERAHHLTEEHFRGAGWSSREIPVVVQGMGKEAAFPAVFIGNSLELDSEVLAAEVEEMTEEFIRAHPRAGAILLEVTNMCPFSALIQEVSGLPVFDINTLINLMHQALLPRKYA